MRIRDLMESQGTQQGARDADQAKWVKLFDEVYDKKVKRVRIGFRKMAGYNSFQDKDYGAPDEYVVARKLKTIKGRDGEVRERISLKRPAESGKGRSPFHGRPLAYTLTKATRPDIYGDPGRSHVFFAKGDMGMAIETFEKA